MTSSPTGWGTLPPRPVVYSWMLLASALPRVSRAISHSAGLLRAATTSWYSSRKLRVEWVVVTSSLKMRRISVFA